VLREFVDPRGNLVGISAHDVPGDSVHDELEGTTWVDAGG